ncbi:MAG: hypothetical protein LQ343_005092 [Gyalolechia ehrenbergii]|nr:MAG: hypothetical protein LQ343_005092 [Gyalolechia ehrenbergii]
MTSPTLHASQTMRIDIPEPQYQSIPATDYGDSDPETPTRESTTTDEDMQSVVGISISRTQTRLKSPTASAAEKAAALDRHGEKASFDDLYPPAEHTQVNHAKGGDCQSQFLAESRLEDRDPLTYESPIITTLPTPWTSGPKLFEQDAAQSQSYEEQKSRQRAATGNTGSLVDLNIRRFWSNFTLPSLPRSPNIRDIPMPALSAVMGGKVDARSPDIVGRHRRANSDMSQKSHRWPQRLDSLKNPLSEAADPFISKQDSKTPLQIAATKSHCNLPNIDDRYIRQPSLKRATSDQSLTLRRAASTASSLGDDSRWEHVQKQVNSRAKAIADTFQDTNIRLPSLPSLPSMNLSILKGRPDFLRNRAVSDIIRPPKSLGARGQDPPMRNSVHQQSEVVVSGDCRPASSPQKSPQPVIDQALECLTGDVVILGGYRGSVLRSAKPPNRQLWVPVKVGLNIRRVNLEVGLEPEDEEKMEGMIIPSGMLSHIGPVDMGRRLLKRLRACRNAQEGKLRVHDYGYDWRLSPHLLSRRLVKYLESLHSNVEGLPNNERGAVVIAHSLGGLITRHAVNQRPELFAGVVYAGVPQHCINILGPLRKGDEVLLSSKVLTAQVNFTFRTSYLLLPEDGRCFIDKQTKEEYPVNFFDVAEWKSYAFSPCIAPTSPPPVAPERKSILSFMTDNLPSLPLVERMPIGERRGSDPNYISTKTKPKASGTPAAADVNPKVDSRSYSSGSSDTPRSTIPLQKAESYLASTLAGTIRFKAELKFIDHYARSNLYPPLSVLYSTSVPTVYRARVASREAIKCSDAYDNLAFASGDGVCLARAAMLPEGYRHVTGGKVRTERGHVGLLGDLEAVGKCLSSVLEGRRKGIGLGTSHNEYIEKEECPK